MATPNRGFGKPKAISGKGGNTSLATLYPLDMIKYKGPIPVTVGGSSNVTFTLKGSTRPIPIWNGNDYQTLNEDLAYTWDSTSNDILDSAGADATDADSVLGVWYFYIAINDDATGSFELRPSQTGPVTYASGAFDAGVLGHPGTSRTKFWTYVGPHICTTADLAFSAMTKIGYNWRITEAEADVPSASWAAPTNLTLFIPMLGFAGLTVNIGVENGLGGRMYIGAHTASTLWDAELGVQEVTSNVALQTSFLQFIASPNDTTSPIYARAVLIAGKIHVNGFKDVV